MGYTDDGNIPYGAGSSETETNEWGEVSKVLDEDV